MDNDCIGIARSDQPIDFELNTCAIVGSEEDADGMDQLPSAERLSEGQRDQARALSSFRRDRRDQSRRGQRLVHGYHSY